MVAETALVRILDGIAGWALLTLDRTGAIVESSAGTQRLTGYANDEIAGLHYGVFFPDEDRSAAAMDEISRIAASRYETEGWRVRKDGRPFWAHVIGAPVDETSAHSNLAVLIGDLSKQHRAKEVLARSEERFSVLLEAVPNAMLAVDPTGKIKMMNRQAERVFGYSRAELLDQNVDILVPQAFRSTHTGLRETFFQAPEIRPMGAGRDLYALRRDGSEFPVEIGLNPIETEYGPLVLSAIVDITDRKQREATMGAALKEKNLLLGEIHHRVKNNLQVVCSLLDLQSSRTRNAEVTSMLRDGQNRIRSMALIHQTLYQSQDFARVEFSNFLDTLVPELSASYSIDPDKIKLSVDAVAVSLPISSAIPCGLMVNELVTNALKHAFPNGRSGQITIQLQDHGDDVVLSVVDTGIGLPGEFDLDNSNTLGLQIVQLLTDQVHGALTIQPAHPTRFSVRIPVHDGNGLHTNV